MEIAYGPVPSRRLGQSLGINNIPPKTCTYACVYCQLGPTTTSGTDRLDFYATDEIVEAVETRVQAARENDEPIDYLSFVPDGEPTLDANLEETITRLQPLGIDIAVITNGSLIAQADVREALLEADYVSLKVDAGAADIWAEVDRPNGRLSFDSIVRGAKLFASEFDGTLTTETMLVDGVNDDELSLRKTAELVAEIAPDTAYIAVPTRPPDEEWVEPPDEATLATAYQLFDDRIDETEYLIGAEPDTFASTGDVRTDILSATAVHPMRQSGLEELLAQEGVDWDVVEALLDSGELITRDYRDTTFYMRPIAAAERD
ncbi:MAG: radical SAM protein [Halapricum sp.]